MVVMPPAVVMVVTPAVMVMAVTPSPRPVMVVAPTVVMVPVAPAVMVVSMSPAVMVVSVSPPPLHGLHQSGLILAHEIGARRQRRGLSRAGEHGGHAKRAQPAKNSHSHGSISWITNLRSSGKT